MAGQSYDSDYQSDRDQKYRSNAGQYTEYIYERYDPKNRISVQEQMGYEL